MNASIRLSIAGLSGPVLLDGCALLARTIARLLPGWRIEKGREDGAEPLITIRRIAQGYVRQSPWTAPDSPLAHPVDAACDFLVDLTRAHIAASEGWLCLHAAAIDTSAGLVVFPSSYGAGKSTLAMHAAAAGARLFADDVMPLTSEGEGVAPGILPRLRLPLAAETRRVLAGFLKRREGAHSARFAYFAMNEGELAGLGERRPIAALVLLERRTTGGAELSEVGVAEMLKSVILRNFSQAVGGAAVLDRLHDLVENRLRLRLAYSSAEEAQACLCARFPFFAPRRR